MWGARQALVAAVTCIGRQPRPPFRVCATPFGHIHRRQETESANLLGSFDRRIETVQSVKPEKLRDMGPGLADNSAGRESQETARILVIQSVQFCVSK